MGWQCLQVRPQWQTTFAARHGLYRRGRRRRRLWHGDRRPRQLLGNGLTAARRLRSSTRRADREPGEGLTFGGKLGLMQGIIATPGGDIWASTWSIARWFICPREMPAKGQLLFVNHSGNPKENPGRLAGTLPSRDRPARPDLGYECRCGLGDSVPGGRSESEQSRDLQDRLRAQWT